MRTLAGFGKAEHVKLDKCLESLEDYFLNVGVLGMVSRKPRVVGQVDVGVGLVVDRVQDFALGNAIGRHKGSMQVGREALVHKVAHQTLADVAGRPFVAQDIGKGRNLFAHGDAIEVAGVGSRTQNAGDVRLAIVGCVCGCEQVVVHRHFCVGKNALEARCNSGVQGF